jgi:hypothetical protein
MRPYIEFVNSTLVTLVEIPDLEELEDCNRYRYSGDRENLIHETRRARMLGMKV